MIELERAISLRNEGRCKEANEILKKLVQADPDNPLLNYHYAWSFDVLEQERDAIPYYEKAILMGLKDDDLRGAYIGLGSTYRTIGEYQKSQKIFEKGIRDFPRDNALKVFYTMTLYNMGEHAESMKILLNLLTDTTSDSNISEYTKAIQFYAKDLNRTW